MGVAITMPKLGLSMVTGTVGKWLKAEGQAVAKGDEIIEIMTDKITNVVEAPVSGVLLKIVAATGRELPIGAVLGFIGAVGEKFTEADTGRKESSAAAVVGSSPVGTAERIRISPLARKLAEEKGLDYSHLAGTGPSGRITREDIEKAAAAEQVPATTERDDPPAASPGLPSFTVSPYTGMRQIIGENMAHSWTLAPKVDYHVSVDIAALLALKNLINQDCEEKVTVTDILVKVTARALKLKPALNASLDGSSIRSYREQNIGVAVALENGLVVPVVRGADTKSLSDVSRELRDLVRRAKAGQLTVEEMRGGTFTITNIGTYNAVDWFTPIINQPQAAILGVGRTVESPVVSGGQVVIRPMMGLSLSFDHRVVDGAPAAEFLGLLIKLIEKPYSVLV